MYQSIMTDRAVVSGIRESALFGKFPEPDRQRLMARAFIAPLKDLDRLAANCADGDRLLLIVDGYLGIYDAPLPDGQLIDILGAGEIVGLPEVLLGNPFPHHLAAIGRPKVAVLPATPIRKILTANPDMAMQIVAKLANRLQSLIRQVAVLKSMTAPQRVANFLLALAADRIGKENLDARETPLSYELPFNKKVIAAQLGITPESFSRSLGKLSQVGIHIDKGVVRIDNPALLRRRIDGRWRN